MRPHKITWIVIFAGILLITAGIGLGCSIAAKTGEMNGPVSMGKVVVSVKNQLGSLDSTAFSPDAAEEIGDRLDTYTACTAVSGFISDTVETGSVSYSVRLTGTNWRFPEFNSLVFKYGGHFTRKAEDEGAAYAVIDETLAWNLFKTENAVGRVIHIFDTPFKIVGVYKNDASVGQFLTYTGIPEVYIPVGKLLELDSAAKITTLQIKTGDGAATDKNLTDVRNALMQAGKNPVNYNITDYNIKAVQLRQRPMIIAFLSGLAAMLLLAGLFVKTALRTVRLIREGCRNDYLANVIKHGSGAFIPAAVKMLALLAGIIALWLLAGFKLYIPPEYIPDDLTNVQYFVSLIKADIGLRMAGLGFIPSGTELLEGMMESLSNRVFFITLPAGSVLTYLGFSMLRSCEFDKNRAAVYCGIFLLASALLVSIAAVALGMPPVVYLKGIAVLWTLIFIVIYKIERKVISNV